MRRCRCHGLPLSACPTYKRELVQQREFQRAGVLVLNKGSQQPHRERRALVAKLARDDALRAQQDSWPGRGF